jgi:hypothetical protein
VDANPSYRAQTSISSFNQLPTFTTANKILADKFRLDLTKFNKNKNQIIELYIGDKICIVKPSSSLVCDTIVRGILPRKT